jgi:hypothetical protein
MSAPNENAPGANKPIAFGVKTRASANPSTAKPNPATPIGTPIPACL